MRKVEEIAAELWEHVEAGNLAPHTDLPSRSDFDDIVKTAIVTDRAERDADKAPRGFIVFTGTYEVHHTLNSAEERMEVLLDEGHVTPTVVTVDLSQNDNTEPLGLVARKIIDTASSGYIGA